MSTEYENEYADMMAREAHERPSASDAHLKALLAIEARLADCAALLTSIDDSVWDNT